MRVVHPNILFPPDLKLKKACVLYMPAWYTHRFTVNSCCLMLYRKIYKVKVSDSRAIMAFLFEMFFHEPEYFTTATREKILTEY